MNQMISLKTSKFDVLQEDENPNNQIYGQSLLVWLKECLKDEFEFSEVQSEDWGWYCYIDFRGRRYMLGSSAFYEEGEDSSAELEWVFQLDKQRTFTEILFFKEKMSSQDLCLNYFIEFFQTASDISVISSGENA